MTQVPYQIISNGDTATVTAFLPEVGPKVANNDHPAYADIKGRAGGGRRRARPVRRERGGGRYFKGQRPRVSVSNDHDLLRRRRDRLHPQPPDRPPVGRGTGTGTRSRAVHGRSSRTRPSTRARNTDWLRDRDFTITPGR